MEPIIKPVIKPIKILDQPWPRTQIRDFDGIIGERGTRVVFGLLKGTPTALLNVPEYFYVDNIIFIHDESILYDVWSYGPVDKSYQPLLNELNHIGATYNEDTKLRLHIYQRATLGNHFLRELLKQDDLYEVIPHDKLGDIIIYADPSLKEDPVSYALKDHVV